MELKAGYKKTELGIIPEDWDVNKINDFTVVTSGGTPSTLVRDYWNGSIRWMNSGELNLKKVYDVENRITALGLINSATRLIPINCILIGLAGQGKTRGTVAINKVELCTNQSIAAILPCDKVSYDFLYYNLDARYSELRGLSTGDGGRGGLNLTIIKNLEIPIPPISEQITIATALSDADDLIKNLEKLIIKKRNIKQGVMQKLLKPQENWEVKPFKDLCWFQEGPGLRNWQFTKRGIKVINVTNLENGLLNLDRTDRHISLDEFHKMYEHFEIDENDIVVASSGNSYGKVAVVRKQDLPLVMNTSVIRFKPLSSLDYNFLLTYLKSSQFKNQIDLLITGGAQPNFGPVHLNKITINMPPTKEEQIKIASVILDMDNEILALETKLVKYRKVKLGMMQNLLKGKIRLV
jgi:type I restriction enzyme, S subunit